MHRCGLKRTSPPSIFIRIDRGHGRSHRRGCLRPGTEFLVPAQALQARIRPLHSCLNRPHPQPRWETAMLPKIATLPSAPTSSKGRAMTTGALLSEGAWADTGDRFQRTMTDPWRFGLGTVPTEMAPGSLQTQGRSAVNPRWNVWIGKSRLTRLLCLPGTW